MITAKTFFREPLVVFTIISGLIFYLNNEHELENKPVIAITHTDKQNAINQYQRLKGSTLTEQEKEEALDIYIENKIFLNEAYRLQLHDDAIVETRLINKVKALYTSNMREPSDKELQSFYEEHNTKYDLIDVDRTEPIDQSPQSRFENYVYRDWKNQQRVELLQSRLASLKTQYHIQLELGE